MAPLFQPVFATEACCVKNSKTSTHAHLDKLWSGEMELAQGVG